MQLKDEAIVLQCTKYANKKHIIKLFTKNHGIVTCHAIISNSSASKIKTSTLMPLNLISVEIISKQNKEVQTLTEAISNYIYTNIHNDFRKLSIMQFINEVLNKVLKEQIGQPELFDFIKNRLIQLNEQTIHISQFHHCFLTELLTYFGINPINNRNTLNKYFDCREGKYTPIELPFPLGMNEELSALFCLAISTNIMEVKLQATERELLLEGILAYYKMHVPGFNELKSLNVLKEIALA